MELQKPDIMTVMEREGIELKRRGRDLWASCPLHPDKTPSFKISPERQHWHCFGSCSEGGDVIDFVMRLHGFDFKDACKYLNIIPGKPLPPDPANQRRKELLQAFNEWKTDFYFRLCDESLHLKYIQTLFKKLPDVSEATAWLFAEKISRLAIIDYRLNLLAEGEKEILFSMYQEDTKNG